jgi:diguanylate cyclase (GGDEF)-like protein
MGGEVYMEITKSANPVQPSQPSERLVYLVTDDSHFASHLSQQIIHFGYHIQHVRDIKSLPNLITDRKSVAITIDIPAEKKQTTDQDIFVAISALQHTYSNLIFTSDRDDQIVRLKSIRAGGAAFFNKPINIVSLIDKLDALNRSTATLLPFKVLIIEDQLAVASYYQMVLKMSGLDAEIASNPDHVLGYLRDFHPDLILMNTFLSELNASDLARVIRQIDDFVSIPIIFLSNEDDFEKRIEALDLGGDEYLVKPIKASHLIAVIRSRLERSKTLRSYMVRDSLTNLLNHTAFRDVLTQEVNRCKRQNASLALAMVDIDHFKRVNDTYGHAAGDSAIKGLARLLQQRLRKSDIIGRYGGDEFVALLIDCEAEQARQIMDEIRVHFSEIEFYPNESKSLSLTFSCGISTFPEHQNAESMSDSADQALYIAKAGQRNQVIVGSA